jgi:hypothetical protein
MLPNTNRTSKSPFELPHCGQLASLNPRVGNFDYFDSRVCWYNQRLGRTSRDCGGSYELDSLFASSSPNRIAQADSACGFFFFPRYITV